MSREKRAEHAALQARNEEIRREVRAALRWHRFEGEVAGVAYRARVAYFALEGGNSLAFLRASDQNGLIVLKKMGESSYVGSVGSSMFFSWKGMSVSLRQRTLDRAAGAQRPADIRGQQIENIFIEIDLLSGAAGSISVNRHELNLSDVGLRRSPP